MLFVYNVKCVERKKKLHMRYPWAFDSDLGFEPTGADWGLILQNCHNSLPRKESHAA